MVNKVILLGFLGKDPEYRALDGGRQVASFTLATSESYKDRNGQKITNTEWHNIVVWGPQADVVQKYLKKGSGLYLEGKIRTRSYDDRQGVKRYITEIQTDTIKLLPRHDGQRDESQEEVIRTGRTITNSKGHSKIKDVRITFIIRVILFIRRSIQTHVRALRPP